jgi:hypothetical protein
MINLKRQLFAAALAFAVLNASAAVQLPESSTHSAVPADAISDLVTTIRTSRDVQSVSKPEPTSLYQYIDTATVTFIDTTAKRFYAQDYTGGLCVDYSSLEAVPCAVGDKVTTIVGYLAQDTHKAVVEGEEQEYAINYFAAIVAPVISSNDNEFTASTVTFEQIDEQPSYYLFRLVKVEGVTISAGDGKVFAADTPLALTQGEESGSLKVFAGSDLVGTDIPTSTVDITGISCELMGDAVIAPRSLADIAAPQSFDVTETYVNDGQALLPLNTPTVVGRFTAVAKNLANDVAIEITGTNRSMFSVEPSVIKAGTSTTEIVVTYTPTNIGVHKAYLLVGDDIYRSMAYASYDPENPAAVTVDTGELVQFEAAPGSTQQQTITVKATNLADYASVAVMKESNGAFQINTTKLWVKNGDNKVIITFAPKSAGTYTERLQITALGIDPVYVTVKGVSVGATGDTDTEGDAFDPDVKNPLTLLNESFDSVEKNKPISLERWLNVANEGTRAWWGYVFDDDEGNKAAKVTAYDSKVESGAGEACVMTLVTPPLDFVNAGSKILTFRVKGQNLTDDMTDKFEVLYMDLAGDELYTEVLNDSFDLPDTEDESGEWMDYIVDFSNSGLADTFFIGFRFSSTRGVDNSAIYYVDDVTWGRTDIPQIKPAQTEYTQYAFVNQPLTTTVSVGALNLTGDITLSMTGNNPSKFSLDKTTLPSTGGDVVVTFNSDVAGVHTANLVLEAEGAATAYVSFEVNCLSEDSGSVTAIAADGNGVFNVYNMLGVKVLTTTDAADLGKLTSGVYVVNGKKLVIK